jgi:hypothetical protein
MYKINSGRFADVAECVKHSHDNPITIGNISKKILFKGGFIMDEPHYILYEYRQLFMNSKTERDLPIEHMFRPKAVSEFVYGTPDLWYLILLASGLTHKRQLIGPKVSYVDPGKLGQIMMIINKRSDELKATRINPTNVMDRTLVRIDVLS